MNTLIPYIAAFGPILLCLAVVAFFAIRDEDFCEALVVAIVTFLGFAVVGGLIASTIWGFQALTSKPHQPPYAEQAF